MAEPRRWTLATLLLVTYAITVMLVIGVLGFLVDRAAHHALQEEVQHGLVQQALALAAIADTDAAQDFVDRVAGSVDARITLISRDGQVIADSLHDPDSMENHADRPEVMAAVEGRVDADNRVSATTGAGQLYVAVPTSDDTILRLSLSDNVIHARLGGFRTRLIGTVSVAALAGILIVGLVARFLSRPLSRLAASAAAVADGHEGLSVPRSAVAELDDLGRTVGSMAQELGTRLAGIEGERRTLEVILESLPEGTLLVGANDSILYANRSLAEVLGPVPRQLDKVVPIRIQDMVRGSRANHTVVEAELEHGLPVRTLRVTATPLKDRRTLLIVSDITDRRRIDDMRRDFVTNASHELKTPVSSILASAETLQIALAKAPERVPQFATQIETAARTLARLVADLLDLSRVEGGHLPFASVALTAVVTGEMTRLTPLANNRGVALRVEPNPVVVPGSTQGISLAVRNLIDNAIRYTEPGGQVTISIEVTDEIARITVRDTGAGIPQRDIDRIFERFYRVDEARSRATGGTGLGLSIVRHVAESHGGKVTVQSQLGCGSSFTLHLPTIAKG